MSSITRELDYFLSEYKEHPGSLDANDFLMLYEKIRLSSSDEIESFHQQRRSSIPGVSKHNSKNMSIHGSRNNSTHSVAGAQVELSTYVAGSAASHLPVLNEAV